MLSNHDIDRACDRFAAGADPDAVARLIATLLLTLRGTPFVYYGGDCGAHRAARVDRRGSRSGRPAFLAGLQRTRRRAASDAWTDHRPAGSRGTPWLRLPRDSADRNVQRQAADPDSVLNSIALRLRGERGACVGRVSGPRCAGRRARIRATDPGERLIVVLNFTDRIQQATMGAAGTGPATVVLGSHKQAGHEVRLSSLRLEPLEAVIVR